MEIIINDKPVILKKLPLKKYVDLLKAVEELPKHFDKINGKSEKEILSNLPYLIENCAPDIYRIINIASNVDVTEVADNWGLDDLIIVLEGIFTVNNYSQIYNKIKKLSAHLGEKK